MISISFICNMYNNIVSGSFFTYHQVVENLSAEKEVYSTCDQNVLCTRVHQDVSTPSTMHAWRGWHTNVPSCGWSSKLGVSQNHVAYCGLSSWKCLMLCSLRTQNYGSHLEQANTWGIYLLMPSLQHWVMRRHVHSPCSMPSQVAIRCHHLQVEGKRLHLTSGNPSMKSLQYSWPCRHIQRVSVKPACLW